MKKKRIKKIPLFCLLLVILLLAFGGVFIAVDNSVPKEIALNVGEKLQEEISFDTFIYQAKLKKISDDVDENKIGEYHAKYAYKFLFLNKEKDILVKVSDTEAPVFTTFPDKVEVYLNNEYNEKDYPYEVKDNYDDAKDIEVKYTGELDTSKAGEYYLVYTATDKSGNKAEQVRKVIVEKESPLKLSVKDFDLSKYFDDIILKETGNMGSDYMNNLIFAGDSVYWNMARFSIYDKSKIWAKPCTDPANIYKQKVEVNGKQSSYTIPELINKNKPKYLVLNIGGCECQYAKVDDFINEYKKFLVDMKENQKDTKIIIQTFNPVIEQKSTPYINNEGRNKFNYFIAKMCRELDIPLLDISNILKDKNTGKCKKDLCMSDGYHPNKKGMRLIVDYVKTHGYK